MSELLVALSAVFIVGGAFLLVANHLDLPTVPFFILAGLVVGLFVETEILLEFARYGIAFLVFTFGVSIRFDAVRTVLSDSEFVAVGQVAATGSLGFVAGIVLGVPPEQAVYLGIATALSSTIVGTGLLKPEIRKNLVHGRLAESIQFVQDLLAILFILVLSAEAFALDPVATNIGYGVILFVAAVVFNRLGFSVVGRLTEGSDELMIVSIITLLIMFLGAAEYLGISIAVGAFAAGLAVRHEPSEHIGVLNGMASIRDFFVAVFFVTVGALVTVPGIDVFVIAAVLGVLTAVVKPAFTVALLVYKGYEARSATLTSLSLDQVSEFALIIAIEAFIIGALAPTVFDAVILATAATMITSSLSRSYDELIYRALADRAVFPEQHAKVDERSYVPEGISDHVVIVGYGRQGRRLAETCEELDREFVVVENDPEILDGIRDDCDAYVFGDAMEEYTWEKANVTEARVVVSTVDSDELSRRLIEFANGVDVILRSEDAETALKLLDDGALYVSVSDVLASEHLLEQIEDFVGGEISREELRWRGTEGLEGD